MHNPYIRCINCINYVSSFIDTSLVGTKTKPTGAVRLIDGFNLQQHVDVGTHDAIISWNKLLMMISDHALQLKS